MIQTATHPDRDTVLYDGQCRFCRSQIALLRRLDAFGSLRYTSFHDEQVARDFPELPQERLREEMVIVDRAGAARGGAEAVRYLSRRLPLLWPLALPMAVANALGARIGATLAVTKGAAIIRPVVITVALALTAKTAWQLLHA